MDYISIKFVFNLLYCIDDNYNKMAFTSIISVLDSISEKIKINIIHKSENNDLFVPKAIKSHDRLDTINIYKFNKKFEYFPNIENSHISEATYYRLFLEDYLDNSEDYYLYLDADVICIKDPLNYFRKLIDLMIKKNLAISAMKHNEIPIYDKRIKDLGISEGQYFNAGVMLINFSEWKKMNIKEKAIRIIQQKNKLLTLWDQDVLNMIFNKNYLEINKLYNYRMNLLDFTKSEQKYIDDRVSLIHYYGKSKPWTIRGIGFGVSEYYQRNYRKIYSSKYHITHTWKPNSLKFLLQILFSKRFLDLEFRISFLKESFISFFRNS